MPKSGLIHVIHTLKCSGSIFMNLGAEQEQVYVLGAGRCGNFLVNFMSRDAGAPVPVAQWESGRNRQLEGVPQLISIRSAPLIP